MKVSILDDYQDTLRGLACFSLLDGHDVTIWNDHVDDLDEQAGRLADTEALTEILLYHVAPGEFGAPTVVAVAEGGIDVATAVLPGEAAGCKRRIVKCGRQGVVDRVAEDQQPHGMTPASLASCFLRLCSSSVSENPCLPLGSTST